MKHLLWLPTSVPAGIYQGQWSTCSGSIAFILVTFLALKHPDRHQKTSNHDFFSGVPFLNKGLLSWVPSCFFVPAQHFSAISVVKKGKKPTKFPGPVHTKVEEINSKRKFSSCDGQRPCCLVDVWRLFWMRIFVGGKGARKGSWKPKPIDDEELESIDYVENRLHIFFVSYLIL